MSDAFAVIMAGGSGTRFWPASRGARPKQLLPLGGAEESLLAATVRRMRGLIAPERIYVVTCESLREATRLAVPRVSPDHILLEPVGRNTAPCVGWAASVIRRRDPDAVLAVLPADHHVSDEGAYGEAFTRALEAAESGDMVTIGINPSRPETGYGYIETGEVIGEGVCRARRFVEKPSKQRAEQFLAAGRFLWNSGMFFFRAEVILQQIGRHLPGLGRALESFDEAAARGDEPAVVAERYGELPSVSVDHGVMEKARDVAVVPGDFGWSDLGSWMAAWELSSRDEAGNAVKADALLVDAQGCYVSAPKGKLVAVVGLKDVVIVDTDDALLVVPRAASQRVREVVALLNERNDRRV